MAGLAAVGVAGGGEGAGDQAAGLGGVDHVVELEQRRRVERLGVRFGRRGQVSHTLLALGLDTLDEETVKATMGVVLKHQSDAAKAAAELRLN